MENRIKEQQLDLFSDRTSNHYFDDNQLRLWFHSFGYVLLHLLREALQHTPLADARVRVVSCIKRKKWSNLLSKVVDYQTKDLDHESYTSIKADSGQAGWPW